MFDPPNIYSSERIYLSLYKYSRDLGPLAAACLIKLNNFWFSFTDSDTFSKIYLRALFYPSIFWGSSWRLTSIKVSSSCLWISVTSKTSDLLFLSWTSFSFKSTLNRSDKLSKVEVNCLLSSLIEAYWSRSNAAFCLNWRSI